MILTLCRPHGYNYLYHHGHGYMQVSSGALDMAKSGLEQLVTICFGEPTSGSMKSAEVMNNETDTDVGEYLVNSVVRQCVRLSISPIDYIQTQVGRWCAQKVYKQVCRCNR